MKTTRLVCFLVTIVTISGKPFMEWAQDTLDDQHDVASYKFSENTVTSDAHILHDDVTYSVAGCSGSVCSCCFKVWKIEACLVFTGATDGVMVQLSLFGKQVYQGHVITSTSNGSKTITVPKESLPSYIQKVLTGNILIKLSWVTTSARTICFVFETKVKDVGTVAWPESVPQCFVL